jgi:uncharacterized protein (DUF1697 family)
METFVALFRGINVGGNNILPMKELKFLLEDNSFHNPKTYIQSGNVVFDSEKPPGNINLLIEEKYGFKPEVLIIEKKEFLELVSGNPYSSTIGKQIHFYFCKDTPKANVERLDGLKSETEDYAIRGKVLYLYAPDGIGRSKLAANTEKCLGVAATGRNLNTVNKLIEMLESA